MINTTTQAFWEDHASMITRRQRQALTSLIFQNIEDEKQREGYLAELDTLTSKEANRLIVEFSMARWK